MRACLLALLVLAAACGKDDANATTDHPAAPAPEPKQPKKKLVTPGVEIYIDDTSVGHVTPDQAQQWVRVDTIVPEQARKLGKWSSLSLTTASDAPQEITKPTERYPDKVPALYAGADGKVSFGMFDAVEFAKHGTPAMHQDNISELHVKMSADNGHGGNDDGNAAPGDPTKTSIVFKTPAGDVALVGDKLLGIKRDPEPDGADAQGWKLATLLTAAGVKKYDKLVLVGAGGTNLMLDKGDLSDTSVPFLKLNRQAKLRLKVYKKKGDGWSPTGDLKDVQRVEVN